MDFQTLKNSLPPYQTEELKFLSGTAEQEEQRHQFLLSVAKKLVSHQEYDFERRPIAFAVVDNDSPNAAFCPNKISGKDMNDKEVTTEYTPLIFVTKGLLNLCENEDQLAYILGHELGHMLDDWRQGTHQNSKIEEIHSDLSAIDRMARGGYNINEAHTMASHIFFNEHAYDDLIKMISRALDDHPNNESRLNAIDVKIKAVEDSYQKQNIDINKAPVTLLDSDLLAQISAERHITLFEKKLAEKGYETASLQEKQTILANSIVEFEEENPDWKAYYKKPQISKAVFDYITELRKQMPRTIIKQSEYDFLTTYQWGEEAKKRKARLKELLGAYYEHYSSPEGTQRALHSLPFQIVEDSKYDSTVLANAQKQEQFEHSIQDGTNLNLNFVEKLLEVRSHLPEFYGSTLGSNDYQAFISATLSSIHHINLDHYSFGNLKQDVAKFINTGFSSSFLGYYSLFLGTPFDTNDIVQNPFPEEYRFVADEQDRYFYTKFAPSQFPKFELETSEKAIGQQIPGYLFVTSNQYLVEKLLGVQARGEVFDGLERFDYDPDYQTPLKLPHRSYTYLVNQDGIIEDVFPSSEFQNKIEARKEKASLEFHQKIANLVKEQYRLLQTLKSNPETALTETQILTLKHHTGTNYYGKKDTIEKLWENQIYEIKKSYPSILQPDFDETVTLSLLSEEEQRFITEFNPSDDKIVFDAYEKVTSESFKQEKSHYSLPSFQADGDAFYLSLKSYTSFPEHYFTQNRFAPFSFEQAEQILRKSWQILPLREASFLSSERFYAPEAFKLMNFIKSEKEKNPDISFKDIDFSKYQPFAADIIAKRLNGPAENPSDDPFIRNLYPPCILHHILTDKTYTLNIESIINLWPNMFLDVQKEFLPPFLENRANWPEDTLKMCRCFEELPHEVYGSKQILWMAEQIHLETDPQKCLESALILNNIINNLPNKEDKNKLKNALISNLPALNAPLEEKISVYTKLASKNAFADDYVLQNKLLRSFIPQIGQIAEPEKRNALYEIFVQNDNRIQDPDIRRTYQQLWVNSVFEACGSKIDNNSEELHQKIAPYLKRLHATSVEKIKWNDTVKIKDHISPVDRLEMAKLLAEKFVSQKELSESIKPHPTSYENLEQGNKNESHLQIAGIDFFKSMLERDPKEADELIDFLLSKGTLNTAQEYHQHLTATLKNKIREPRLTAKLPSPETLQVIHREFWGYPLEARSVLINDLLHSASSKNGQNRWEGIFNKVADKIFPDGTLQMNKIGKEFLHSYIKARKDSERTLYLSAMMVAANENSGIADPEKALAKGIRLFLENSGPAAIKLGQAMASYTDVPKFIRDEMQYLKSSAARPSRWELYEWLEFYKTQDNDTDLSYGKDVWLGKILGSASYFVTLEKGSFEDGKVPQTSDKVTKILRTGAKLSSDKEFKIFEDMLYDVAQKGIMENGIDSFIRLIRQAKESVVVETDLSIGHSQLETAKQIYKEKQIELDGYSFKLHVADWPEYGKNWADLERAKGSDLDEITDLKYKHAASKAYFAVELMNMLSGGRFDHDRHGKQLKIDTQNNIIGLFDTGAMAVVDPAQKDRELLGQILYRTLEKTLNTPTQSTNAQGIGAVLSEEIENVYRTKQTDSTYLTECQRGLLALTDFYKDFTLQDFKDCFNAALNNKDMPLDKHILHGFVSEGISSVGLFESKQSLLSYQDKEDLGRLLFNTYAATLTNPEKSIGQIVHEQVEFMQNASLKQMPVLQIVSNKLQETEGQSLGLNLPAEFIPTLETTLADKNLDIAILKGITREALETFNLQQEKSAYTPEDRQAFGHLLYNTYATMVQKSKQQEKPEMSSVYLELYKTGQYQTELGGKLAAILTVAQKISTNGNAEDVDLKSLAKSVLLSGSLDQEITKGITDSLMQENKNPLTKHLAAQGLKMFLSQKQDEPSLLKRKLIKLFVKESKTLKETEQQLTDLISKPQKREQISKVLQSYVERYAGKLSQPQVAPKIRITAGRQL